MDINPTDGTSKSFRKLVQIKTLILLMIISALVVFYFFLGGKQLLSPQNENTYQAVFLTSGQVYFGKFSARGRWFVLRDVYYLQAQDSLQSEGDTASPLSRPQKIEMVKLGAELHGPEAEMFIERDKVLFWENMKSDSKVLEAIKQYQDAAL